MANKKSLLECECEDNSQHETTEQENGDMMTKCAECQQFIKYPQE